MSHAYADAEDWRTRMRGNVRGGNLLDVLVEIIELEIAYCDVSLAGEVADVCGASKSCSLR